MLIRPWVPEMETKEGQLQGPTQQLESGWCAKSGPGSNPQPFALRLFSRVGKNKASVNQCNNGQLK